MKRFLIAGAFVAFAVLMIAESEATHHVSGFPGLKLNNSRLAGLFSRGRSARAVADYDSGSNPTLITPIELDAAADSPALSRAKRQLGGLLGDIAKIGSQFGRGAGSQQGMMNQGGPNGGYNNPNYGQQQQYPGYHHNHNRNRHFG